MAPYGPEGAAQNEALGFDHPTDQFDVNHYNGKTRSNLPCSLVDAVEPH
jgi:hypothetical protein